MSQAVARIAFTPGEPAGIGPDLAVRLAQQDWPVELVAIADPKLLSDRAAQLGLPLTIRPYASTQAAQTQGAGTLTVLPIALAEPAIAQQLNPANATYVLATLARANDRSEERRVGKECSSRR